MAENTPEQESLSTRRVKEFIETMDKLAYEKPAGFIAYLATCLSSQPIPAFTEQTEKDKPK
jgi:hypothetical protein